MMAEKEMLSDSQEAYKKLLGALQQLSPEQVSQYEWHLTSLLNTFSRHYCHLLSEEPGQLIQPIYLEVSGRRFKPLYSHARLINLYIGSSINIVTTSADGGGDKTLAIATTTSLDKEKRVIYMEIQYTSEEMDSSNVKRKSVIEAIPILDERVISMKYPTLIDESELPVQPAIFPSRIITYNTIGVTKHPLKLLLVNEQRGFYRDEEGDVETLLGLQGFYVDKRFLDTSADIKCVYAPSKPDQTWRAKEFTHPLGAWAPFKLYLFGHPSISFVDSQIESLIYKPRHRLYLVENAELTSPGLLPFMTSEEESMPIFETTYVPLVVPTPVTTEKDELTVMSNLLAEYQGRNDELQQELILAKEALLGAVALKETAIVEQDKTKELQIVHLQGLVDLYKSQLEVQNERLRGYDSLVLDNQELLNLLETAKAESLVWQQQEADTRLELVQTIEKFNTESDTLREKESQLRVAGYRENDFSVRIEKLEQFVEVYKSQSEQQEHLIVEQKECVDEQKQLVELYKTRLEDGQLMEELYKADLQNKERYIADRNRDYASLELKNQELTLLLESVNDTCVEPNETVEKLLIELEEIREKEQQLTLSYKLLEEEYHKLHIQLEEKKTFQLPILDSCVMENIKTSDEEVSWLRAEVERLNLVEKDLNTAFGRISRQIMDMI